MEFARPISFSLTFNPFIALMMAAYKTSVIIGPTKAACMGVAWTYIGLPLIRLPVHAGVTANGKSTNMQWVPVTKGCFSLSFWPGLNGLFSARPILYSSSWWSIAIDPAIAAYIRPVFRYYFTGHGAALSGLFGLLCWPQIIEDEWRIYESIN